MPEPGIFAMKIYGKAWKLKKAIALALSLLFLFTGCGKASPAVPSLLSSATYVPPTEIYVPPSTTHLPPTQEATSIPSATITLTPTLFPTLSASGGVIAFASLQNSSVHVYLINADGSQQTRLTNNVSGGVEPSWSPDGTKIVFQYNGLWIADIATGEISSIHITTTLENRYIVQPSWSPDGEWIAFINENGTVGDIYLIRPDGTGLGRLTYSNDVSRDGNLVWSPDGEEIVFSADRQGNIEIYILDVAEALNGSAGGNQRQLTGNGNESGMRNFVSSWSPDGSRIAFTSNRDGNSEIYLMNPDGSDVVRLTDNPASDKEPAWSPDGSMIAFSSDRNGSFDIFVMGVAGTLQGTGSTWVRRLTTSPGDDVGPAWMPLP
jgi:Tol biopolymer transport system component